MGTTFALTFKTSHLNQHPNGSKTMDCVHASEFYSGLNPRVATSLCTKKLMQEMVRRDSKNLLNALARRQVQRVMSGLADPRMSLYPISEKKMYISEAMYQAEELRRQSRAEREKEQSRRSTGSRSSVVSGL